MSGVKCQVSGVRCQVLGVRFQVSSFTCKKIMLYFFVCFCDDLLELYGGGSVINGAYLVIVFLLKCFGTNLWS